MQDFHTNWFPSDGIIDPFPSVLEDGQDENNVSYSTDQFTEKMFSSEPFSNQIQFFDDAFDIEELAVGYATDFDFAGFNPSPYRPGSSKLENLVEDPDSFGTDPVQFSGQDYRFEGSLEQPNRPDLRGERENRRDSFARQERTRVKFVCRDPATVGILSTIQAVVPLSDCKACLGGKEYGAYYNAIEHLRRAHFSPKYPRGSKDRGKDRGNHAQPDAELLKDWYTEIKSKIPE